MITQMLKKTPYGVSLCAFIFLLFLNVPARASVSAGSNSIAVSPGSITSAPGQSISLSVTATTLTANSSIQFTLTYDPTVLSAPTVALGSATSGWFLVSNPNTAGKLTVGMFTTGALAASPTTQQQIALIGFTVNSSAANTPTALTLSSVTFSSTSVTSITSGSLILNLPPPTYTITANISGNGSITCDGSSCPSPVNAGTSETFSETPSTGYAFSSWSGVTCNEGTQTGKTCTVVVNGDISVLATFNVQTETIAVTSGAGGVITCGGTACPTSVDAGTSVTFTGTPDTGYSFGSWSGVSCSQGSQTGGSCTVTVNSNISVSANFTVIIQTETVTVNAGTGGTITCGGTACPASVNAGTSVTFTETPNTGYNFGSWSGVTCVQEGSQTGSSCTVTVNSNISVSAGFTQQTETLTINAGSGGAITPTGTVTVDYGASQTFTLTPNAGYTAALTVDGNAVTLTDNTYTLSDVTTSHTLAAGFTLQKETITASAGADGSISPSGLVSVNYGADQTFTVTANSGYDIDQVLVDGSAVTLSSSGTYSFSDVKTNHTIAATFRLNTQKSKPPKLTLMITRPQDAALVSNPVVVAYTTNGAVKTMRLDDKSITVIPSGGKLPSLKDGKHKLVIVSVGRDGDRLEREVAFKVVSASPNFK